MTSIDISCNQVQLVSNIKSIIYKKNKQIKKNCTTLIIFFNSETVIDNEINKIYDFLSANKNFTQIFDNINIKINSNELISMVFFNKLLRIDILKRHSINVIFGKKFNFGLKLSKFKNIHEIKICSKSTNVLASHFPPNLNNLRFTKNHKILNSIPNVSNLYLNKQFNNSIHFDANSIIKNIYFGDYYDRPIDNLPLSVKYISLGEKYNCNLDYLPESIEEIYINSNHFNQPLDNLPNNISKITLIVPRYDYVLYNLPSNLKYFKFEIVPKIDLKFNTPYIYEHDLKYLPKSLEELHIYDYAIDKLANLPKSLNTIHIVNAISKSRMYELRTKAIKLSVNFVLVQGFHNDFNNKCNSGQIIRGKKIENNI